MHPCWAEFSGRDYFHRQKSSLFAKISCQGLFPSVEIISIRKNFLSGITFIRRNHLYLQKLPVRDYFHRQKSSLFAGISCQGLLSSAEIISIRRNFLSGIIFIGRNHLYPQEFPVRDYFHRQKSFLFARHDFRSIFLRFALVLPLSKRL